MSSSAPPTREPTDAPVTEPTHDADALARWRQRLVVLLTVNAGATDAIGFLALGGAFTSVMTGNLVLFGISIGHADRSLAGHILTAIVCYVVGCVVGARIAGTAEPGQAVWPRHVTRALTFEFALFAAVAVGWWASGCKPGESLQLVLLGADALALGVQGSSVQRFGVSGLSTTYMTGTLTTMVVHLTSGGEVRRALPALQLLLGLVAGAIIAALLVAHASYLVPLAQLVPVGIVLAGAVAVMHREHARPTDV